MMGRMPDARMPIDVEGRRLRRQFNHIELAVLFGVLWLLASFHLLILLRDEVWPHGWAAIVMCAVPPAVPLVQLAWGNFGMAATFAVPAIAVGISWRLAAARAQNRGWEALACICIILYWLFYDFVLAFGA